MIKQPFMVLPFMRLNMFNKRIKLFFLLLFLLFLPINILADTIRIAVASNFSHAIKDIAHRFEVQTGHKVILIFGSSGKHYAQIINGAPFELFFSADTIRPSLLEKKGLIQDNSRFTYAIGQVVLWSPNHSLIDKTAQILHKASFRYLAVANPKLAPYGKAAQQILTQQGLWTTLRLRMVRGENIGQTFQFVKSGNAELGFVAFSQIKSPDKKIKGSYWKPDQALYDPIQQQAVLLKNNDLARAFLKYIKQDEALNIIRAYGYRTP